MLVYAEAVTANDGFSLLASSTPVQVTAVTPASGTNSIATLNVIGAGFTNPTSVALVAADNTTTYSASAVTFDTFTQLTATFNLAGVPQGVYSVQVTNNAGVTDTLPAAFTVTAPGQANLVTHLILPAVIGRHIPATFYVEYANAGTVAMPAPLLVLESSVADDVPVFTLNKALQVPSCGPRPFLTETHLSSRSWPAARPRRAQAGRIRNRAGLLFRHAAAGGT